MATSTETSQHLPWYRSAIAWLGIAIFAASIAGCIWIISVSARYRDEPVQTPVHSVLGVPTQAPAPASSS